MAYSYQRWGFNPTYLSWVIETGKEFYSCPDWVKAVWALRKLIGLLPPDDRPELLKKYAEVRAYVAEVAKEVQGMDAYSDEKEAAKQERTSAKLMELFEMIMNVYHKYDAFYMMVKVVDGEMHG